MAHNWDEVEVGDYVQLVKISDDTQKTVLGGTVLGVSINWAVVKGFSEALSRGEWEVSNLAKKRKIPEDTVLPGQLVYSSGLTWIKGSDGNYRAVSANVSVKTWEQLYQLTAAKLARGESDGSWAA